MKDPRFGSPLERGWYYVPGHGARPPKRPVGVSARIEVVDVSGAALHRATLLRAALAVGGALERGRAEVAHPLRVRLLTEGAQARVALDDDGVTCLSLDGPGVAAVSDWRSLEDEVAALLADPRPAAPPRAAPRLPERPARRVLFFESLMNTAIDHNDQEISQGVLHMASALRGLDTEPVLARVKMTIFEQFRHERAERTPIVGLDSLEEALSGGPIELVIITLLEAYFPQVERLIATLRGLGCRAHIAVGGVMPTLSPDQVAAHLDGVSFVCRGAGEYFVPAFARILGAGASIDQPLDAAQRAALLALDGLIAFDAAGRRLIVGESARAVSVDDLDAVELDLSLVRRDHLVHGVEISTSRGCIHRCAFCTIVGRMTYQARSPESVFALLERYHQRFGELFGEAVPQKLYRVHISDDDFVCDRERAIAFFDQLPATPFRLASCQVSVADLCRRDGGKLLPEVDEALLDAMAPERFFDSQRPISPREHIEDYGERRWSAYLQLGVESFHDGELRRYAKGFRVAHIRAVVAATAARGLHLDAYFILSNVDTRASELVEALREAARLKLRHPRYFHVKYPVTPRLVSIFPSASYRRHARAGALHHLRVDRVGAVPGHPELDYPFVTWDLPADPLVELAAGEDFFSHGDRYAESLARLRERWRASLATLDADTRGRAEALIRATDDGARQLVFELLRERGLELGATPELDAAGRLALQTARELLGEPAAWRLAYRRYLSEGPLVVRVAASAGEARALDALALAASSARPEREVEIELAAAGALPERLAQRAAELGVTLIPVALIRVSPEGVAGVAGAVSEAAADGVGAVRIDPIGSWPEAAQRDLAQALRSLDGLPISLRVPSSAPPAVTVAPSGALSAGGAPAGHLDELAGVDRLAYDAPASTPTPTERLLNSYVAWRARRVASAPG